MNVEESIITLLQRHECVIVPGLGGFVKNRQGAAFHPLSHTFYPPSARITFNRHLQHNDGLLAGFMAEKYQKTFAEATLELNRWLEQKRKVMQDSRYLPVKGLGTLHNDTSGNWHFTQDTTHNYLAESYGFRPVMSVPVHRETLKEKASKQVEAKVVQLTKPETPAKRKWVYAAAAVLLPLLISAALLPLLAPAWFENTQYSRFFSFSFAKDAVYQVRNNYADTMVSIAEDTDLRQWVSQLPDTADVVWLPLFESGKKFPVQIHETEAVTTYVKKEKPPKPSSRKQRYHIIGGCFAVEENAHNFTEKLRAEGYKASIIGKRKGLFTVAFESFTAREEALVFLQQAKHQYAQAWLLDMPL